jgi:chaperone modulatory protein CbpM
MKLVISEAARRVGIEPELIERFILFAWVRPASDEPALLDELDIARCQLIHELQNEFGVNDAAVPVILELVDQLHRLQAEAQRR